MMKWDNRILRSWANRFHIEEQIFSGSRFTVHAVSQVEDQVHLCMIGNAQIALIPQRFAQALDQAAPDALKSLDALSDWLRASLRFQYRDYTYYTTTPLAPAFPLDNVRVLSAADAALLSDLQAQCSASELAMSEITIHDPLVMGCLAGNHLIGVASVLDWGGDIFDIGVLTHPAHRGQNIGAALTTALSNEVIQRGGIPQYRADEQNRGSVRIAEKCGFVRFAVEEEYTMQQD